MSKAEPMLSWGPGMVARRLLIRAPDVVFAKGIVDAHDGLAQVSSSSGGDLLVVAPSDRERELDELVRDLARELGGVWAIAP